MAEATEHGGDQSQLDKFTDDDPERYKERVGKVVKHKPVPEKPE